MNLHTKMLLFSFGIVAALTGLSLTVIHYFVSRQVEIDIQEDLQNTHSVFESLLDQRSEWLRSQSWVVAEDPRFLATLDIPDPDFEYQAQTVIREARRFQNILGSDLFIVTDRTGTSLGHLEMRSFPERDLLSHLPSLSDALQGEPAHASGSFEGLSLHLASVPLQENGRRVGALTLGFTEPIDRKTLLSDLITYTNNLETPAGFEPPPSATHTARELQSSFGADFVALVNSEGRSTALIARFASFGQGLSGSPVIRRALEGEESAGMNTQAGRLVQLVAVPVWTQRNIIGALCTGFEINDDLAQSLQEMTHSAVSFILQDRLVASSWQGLGRLRLAEEIRSHGWNLDAAAPVQRLLIDSETFLSKAGPLRLQEPEQQGFYLIQRSLDQAVGFLGTIRNVLLSIGITTLAVAGAVSFLGTGRIVEPVRALVKGTRRLASGDLSYRLPATSGDELGELARSFNEMAETLAVSQEALAESGRRYRDLFDNAQDFVYTTDLELRFTSVNKAGLDLLDYAAEELVGRSFFDLVAPQDLDRIQKSHHEHDPSDPRTEFEVQLLKKSGDTVSLEIVSRWIVEAGTPIGRHGIGRDISARREREKASIRFREQVHQAEKLRALGEMAAGAAHNFNNLLTGVIGFAQLLEEQDEASPQVRRYARMILQAGERCAAVVRRIQTFGRPSDSMREVLVNLNRVVQDTIEWTRPKWKDIAQREGREISVQLNLTDVPPISSTPAAWEEILSNLIFNASDAMPQGGVITVSTRRAGRDIELEVADTGTGMDPETQKRIFDPFFTTKAPELGTGLGLSTVWGLVKGLGGSIEVQSAPEQGTSFGVRVPIRSEKRLSKESLPLAQCTETLRVLVVDDEAPVLEVLSLMLPNHDVVTVSDADQALQELERADYDILITDWSMSGMSGLDLTAEVKRRRLNTVVILMTGFATPTSTTYSSGVDLYLSKPLLLGDVRKVMTAALEILQTGAVGPNQNISPSPPGQPWG